MKLGIQLIAVLLCIASAGFSVAADSARKTSPKDAKVYIISPVDGATVKNPVTVQFGLKGMGVAPAGLFKENTGHHHLLIDVEKLPDVKAPIPSDKNHVHFGGGQTETTVTLTPGKHTLQLLLGDLAHVPHNPPVVSEKITVTVSE